ncbi:NAD(P)-binding protein [Parathielavia hyrcaniae]|uniref:3-dehydrosphinganine reductase n=1 Tax=Parathielavia hyrcaniae TaxID=113614 RepID=A0AAN6T6J1_9PEZI|nr:NAD(P)-binding protein [Parathielavia hyrcaniae]
MDILSSLGIPLPIATGVLAVLIALIASMGLFGKKNHMPVEGRTVLITGSSEGMGRSAAIQLAAKGANVILVSRNVGRLEEALVDVKAAASSPSTQRFTYISADVSEPDYAAAVIAEATAWNGGCSPDIVWCVAGMSTPLLWTDDGSLSAARRIMDVNYFGSADMSRAVLREWLAPENSTGPGSEPKHIVFTASVLALFAIAGYGPYTPSKWALRGLADTLAMELNLYPDNPVRVHVVYPATITSPGLERENQTKPGVTRKLEEGEPPETPETVARRAIEGLERGEYFVAVSFLGNLMRCGVMGGSPRNNWVLDTLLGWIVPIIYFFVLRDMNGQVKGWSKLHGHPGNKVKATDLSPGSSMKSSSQRGRPTKVTKPAPPPRGRAPRPVAAHLATHEAQVHDDLADHLKADPSSVFGDAGMAADDYAAAAAAAAAMDTDLTEDAHGEAEPEADMDDDHDHGAGTASGLPPHVDLATANMLANGGASDPGSTMSPPGQDQLHEMQHSLAHAQHAHQHQQQHQHQHQHPHPNQHQHQPPAQMSTPQQMQPAHQPMDPSMMKTTEELARDSGYGELNVESALAKRLAREPGQRLAQQRRPEQTLNLGRRSNVEALFAHIAGEPARVPCKNCHKGHGPWTSCVVVDGQMCGSCANCWFNASGARCSFHETRNIQVIPQHSAILPATAPGLAGSDPTYRFSTPHPLLQSHAPAMGSVSHAGTLWTSNPVLQQMVQRAMAEVRAADKATRQLIQIDVTAKQLALQIAEYEDMVSSQGSPGGQQVMGDESGV